MRRTFQFFIAAAAAAVVGVTLYAQAPVPDIQFDAVNLLKTPDNVFVGEVGGVATNSRGNIFVYTRTGHAYATLGDSRTFYHGGSKLFEFDSTGKYVRELGQESYGFNAAIGLRVDAQDNVWTMDAGASQVVKFDSQGRIALVLGRKPETINVRAGGGLVAALWSGPIESAAAPAAGGGRGGGGAAPPEGRGAAAGAAGAGGAGGGGRAGGGAGAGAGAPGGGAGGGRGGGAPGGAAGAPGGAPAAAGGFGGGGRGGGAGAGSGTPGSGFSRPADVTWDRSGNIYVADGIGGTNRVAKFDKDGKFILHWGSTGSGEGQFQGVKGVQIDAQGNIYVADLGNKRIQVFDGDGKFKSQLTGFGSPQAICMTRGATQYLYVSHWGDNSGMDDATIYKVTLTGQVVGKFGSAGKGIKQFGLANSIDCRNENELLIGEMANWRVQKVTLRAAR